MRINNKIWFCGMSGPNSIKDLKELLEPIKNHVSGILWTLHDCKPEDEETKYLESIKKNGCIIHSHYVCRHDNARNQYLWCGKPQFGQWLLVCDLLERLAPKFIYELPKLIEDLEKQQINTVYYYGKPLLFQWDDSLVYHGTPHERLVRQNGADRAIELSNNFPNESDVRINIRPYVRDDKHFIKHYAKYALFPFGSNHYYLGLENNPKRNEIFNEREKRRLEFLELLKELNINPDVDSLLFYMESEKMDWGKGTSTVDPRFKDFISKDKNFNDLYRYYILHDKTVKDDHDWSNLVPYKS